MFYLGIDTSNYTTSAALYNSDTGAITQKKKLLPVKKGERGLRQSDAVFHHTVQLPVILEELFSECPVKPDAVGASVTPTTADGSYMPCFLVGESTARAIGSAFKIPVYRFSHQQGHIMAALYSADKLQYLNSPFIAFHVSGGTTDAVMAEPSDGRAFKVTGLSSSNDLKAGQAIDRIGVKMGLSFPAGAALDRLSGESTREFHNKIKLYDGCCSLSGLENKCLKMLENGESNSDTARFLFSYIADTLEAMATYLTEQQGKLPLVFSGGVTSNTLIRERLQKSLGAVFAQPEFSSDNAAGTAILSSLQEGTI